MRGADQHITGLNRRFTECDKDRENGRRTDKGRRAGFRKFTGLAKKLRRGFTLMELLVVVAIIGILGALAVVGVIRFNKSLKVMELNNTAEEIYIAAQNHLTAAQANAVSAAGLEKSNAEKLSAICSQPPKDADSSTDWDSMLAFDNSSNGSAAAGTAVRTYNTLTSIILPSGAVDAAVSGDDSSWIIEYNPESFTVYGVFYADGKSAVLGNNTGARITVSDLRGLNALVLNAGNSTKIEDYGPQKICVGYYGGNDAGKIDTKKLTGKLSVRVENKERLYAVIKNDVKVEDDPAAEVRLVVRVEGMTSGASRTFGVNVGADGKIDIHNQTDALLWSQSDKSAQEIRLLLDDITQEHTHFADLFRDGTSDNGQNFIPGENIVISAYAQTAEYLSDVINSSNSQRTNSLFEKLTKSDDGGMTVEQVSIGNFRHLENLSARVSHVMRMTGSSGDAENAVSLTVANDTYQNGRYAFRAVMTSDLTDARTEAEKKKTEPEASVSRKNKSWSGFFYNCGKSVIDKSGNNDKDFITFASADSSIASGSSYRTSDGSFSPINNIYLSEFDGNNKTIEGLYVSSSDSLTEARGLFGTILQKCDCTIKDITLKNVDISASRNTFSDVIDNNKSLICAGGLAGRIVSDDHKVTVENAAVLEEGDNYCGIWCPVLSNRRNATPVRNGGLAGEIQTGGSDTAAIWMNGCSASVYVQSSAGSMPNRINQPGLADVDIAGGLIGHVEGNTGKIYVENSYAGGHTENALASPYYSSADKIRGKNGTGRNITSYGIAGGLIGAVYTKNARVYFSSDYSTASAACASGKIAAKFSDAGGLIGYVSKNIRNISAEECYSTGLVEGDLRGGVIGYAALGAPASGDTLKTFKNCRFLEQVSTKTAGEDIPAVNILTQHADSVSGSSQMITPYDQFSGSVYPADYASLTAGGGTAKAAPYDQNLLHAENYPFVSARDIHYGDWPVSETDQSFEGDFGVLYYEIVQHGTDKSARDYYYHGFVGDLTDDGSKLNYEEVNTLNTNAQACVGRPCSKNALLTGHDEYVVEEGYLILSSKEYQKNIDQFNEEHKDQQNTANSESITVEIGNGGDGNNSDLTIASKIKDGKMAEYDAFLTEAHIVGYHAYAINCGKYTSEAGKSVSLMIRDRKFNNGNDGTIVAYSQFYFQPVFSDTLSKNELGNFQTYKIRSAKQLKLMFENGGNTTTEAIQNGKENLSQTLDISYDSEKVRFTELAFDGKPDSVRGLEKENKAYVSPCFSENFNTNYNSSTPFAETSAESKVRPDAVSGALHYRLDGLNRTFIRTLGGQGSLSNIRVTDVDPDNNADDFIDTIVPGGKLQGADFDNCSFTHGLVGTNRGQISDTGLDHCGGTTFVYLNQGNSALITNVTINHSDFSKAVVWTNRNNARVDTLYAYTLQTPYFVYENTENKAKINNVYVENARFNDSYGGFVHTNDTQAEITNCSVAYADFEGFGFVNDNKGDIRDCHISDAVIEFAGDRYGGGFVCSNTGTIADCQIYSNGFDQYQDDYLKKYDSDSVFFHPLHITASWNGKLKANEPESAYDLVMTGVCGNFADKQSDFLIDSGLKQKAADGSERLTEGIGGFSYQNMNNGSIINCSFTGSVFGSIASGFIHSNQSQLTKSYANVIDFGISYACGFMYTNSSGNTDMNHALGRILGMSSGSGFLKDNSGTVNNSYTAVWDENVKSYALFYETGNGNYNNNYAVKDLAPDKDTDTYAAANTKVTLVSDDDLRSYQINPNMQSLGGVPENGTSAYLKALSDTAYPYPMPHYEETVNGTAVNKTLKAYGDWKTAGGLMLNPAEIDIYQGDNYDLNHISVYFNNQAVSAEKLQWILTDAETGNDIVELQNGMLKGIAEGSDSITVTYTDDQNQEGDMTYSARLTVRVIPKTIAIVKTADGGNEYITGTEQTEYVGGSMTLSAVLSPENPDAEISWTSSDPAIADVRVTGGSASLQCHKVGDVIITASVNNHAEYSTASFKLHVPNKSLQIYKDGNPVEEGGITLAAGESVSLSALLLPDQASVSGVTWSSTDASVVSVVSVDTATGTVTAGQTKGTATITAAAEGVDPGTCEIRVVQQNLIAGKINAAGMTIHRVSEYSSQNNGCNISPGTLIVDDAGNYCLVYSTRNYYQITQRSVNDIVLAYRSDIELINENTNVIEVGQDRKVPIPCEAGTILHYSSNGSDEYYVLLQLINWDTTIDNGGVVRIGVQ